MNITLEDEIKKLINPWKDYDDMSDEDNPIGRFASLDQKYLALIGKFVCLENVIIKEKGKDIEYKFINQYPLPINGNFIKSDYLFLCSNPSLEKEKLNQNTKIKLKKCFELDPESRLQIPNKDWKEWYTKQIKLVYAKTKNETCIGNDDISQKFCFINFFAYATNKNNFDIGEKAIKSIKKLESTKFIEQLVLLGLKYKKKIIVLRKQKNVWIDNLFHKLELEIEVE